MSVIEVQNLKKYYGRHLGIEEVSFSVNEGEIFGFVGPNGAGKSTTIKILLNFIFPTGGYASIGGRDVVKDSKKIKEFTGYVPSDVRFYEDMTLTELIKMNNKFYGEKQNAEVDRLCDIFELNKSRRFHELSMGNKKKAAIICALVAKPKVLILDEPTNGLDPMMQKRLFLELKERAENGVTVLLSSHNLAEVQEYCDRVAFIKRGRILAVTDLNKETRSQKIVTLWGGKHIPIKDDQIIEQDGHKRVFRYHGDSASLLKLLYEAEADDFTVENESLEERFMSLYGKEEG